MLYCNNPKITYCATSKTGTTAIEAELRSLFKIKSIGGNKHFLYTGPEFDDYFSITSIRNPYTRAVSLWWYYKTKTFEKWPNEDRRMKYERAKNLSFKEWVYEVLITGHHVSPSLYQYTYFMDPVTGDVNKDAYDLVIRLEHLNEDFNKIPFLPSKVKLHRKNTGNYGSWWPHYENDPKLIKAVKEYFIRDIHLYCKTDSEIFCPPLDFFNPTHEEMDG